MSIRTLALAASLAGSALAHGIVDQIKVDGVWYPGSKNWDAPENQNSPVHGFPIDTGFVRWDQVNTDDIACSSAGKTPRPVTVEVKAGGLIELHWKGDKGPSGTEWPHPEGPSIAYLARCNGPCSSFDPSNAEFFKIQEEGLDTSRQPYQSWIDHLPWGAGMWSQAKLMLEQGSWAQIRIPSNIANGEYLLKHDLISLHGAHSYAEGAQYYPSCTQIRVTGGGNEYPQGTPAKQLYTQNDGIINIYEPFPGGIQSYKIPGPALWTSGSPAPAPSSEQSAPTSSSSEAAPAPSSEASAPASSADVSTPAPAFSSADSSVNPAPSAAPANDVYTPPKTCKARRSRRSVRAHKQRRLAAH